MIKLFRRIRQKLLHEHKLRDYLFYAVGEILLVVIGILIALQINLWNEQRKVRIRECAYFESLISDLQNQIATIESQMDFESEVIQNSELLIQDYHSLNQFIVNSDFSKRISILNNRVTFRASSSTYQELLSTGDLSFIGNPEVKNALLKYYQMVTQFEEIITKNNSYIDNHFAPLALEISTHKTPNHQIGLFEGIISKGMISPDLKESDKDLEFMNDVIQNHLADPLTKLKLLNEIKYRYRISGVHLSIMDILKSESEDLIQLLEAELKECDASN